MGLGLAGTGFACVEETVEPEGCELGARVVDSEEVAGIVSSGHGPVYGELRVVPDQETLSDHSPRASCASKS
jgi:hypothetical protein